MSDVFIMEDTMVQREIQCVCVCVCVCVCANYLHGIQYLVEQELPDWL